MSEAIFQKFTPGRMGIIWQMDTFSKLEGTSHLASLVIHSADLYLLCIPINYLKNTQQKKKRLLKIKLVS